MNISYFENPTTIPGVSTGQLPINEAKRVKDLRNLIMMQTCTLKLQLELHLRYVGLLSKMQMSSLNDYGKAELGGVGSDFMEIAETLSALGKTIFENQALLEYMKDELANILEKEKGNWIL